MDTLNQTPVKSPEQVAQVLQTIKTRMPNTYQAIQRKAQEIGDEAFSLVRQGIRGKPYAFYAFEAGHVVGTPFTGHQVEDYAAKVMCTLGTSSVCLFAAGVPKGAEHGAH